MRLDTKYQFDFKNNKKNKRAHKSSSPDHNSLNTQG